jgi:HPt (histidine-containing phosphotransfer) domain-containing protein
MSRADSNSSHAAADAKSGMSGMSGTSRTSGTGTEKVPEQVTDKGPLGAGTIGAGTIGAGTIGEGTVSRARIDRLRNSTPGNDALIDELIDLFVADLPKRLGAIAHAVERADAPALALQAHALRGGAANFGASRLDELCAKIEEAGVRGRFAETPAMLEEVTRESARVRDTLLTFKSQQPKRGAQRRFANGPAKESDEE